MTNKADTIYLNGSIITMEGEEPEYVEAVAVKDGKIVYVGKESVALELKDSKTKMVDLKGKTMLPGFIDPHGHVYMLGMSESVGPLSPWPDGEVNDIPTLIKTMRKWIEENGDFIKQTGLVIGRGYDDAILKEKRHPIADELDEVSTDLPVFIVHASGHLGAMNHKALEMYGFNADTPNPENAVIRREADGKTPSGVLEGIPIILKVLFPAMAKLNAKTKIKIANAGIQAYARNGYTTMQEGLSDPSTTQQWLDLAEKNMVKVDVPIYVGVPEYAEYMKQHGATNEYHNHVRIAGVKLSIDGSPQGKTAWMTKPYKVPPDGHNKDYVGYSKYTRKQIREVFDQAFKNNWQIMAHANGDAAMDAVIDAVEFAGKKHGNNDRRTVSIHSQMMREDQLDKFKELGIIPSYFGLHTFYWGDWYVSDVVGAQRAAKISPMGSALKRGMRFTNHHDAPVVIPSSMLAIAAAVNRTSRSGAIIGKAERIDIYSSLKTTTIWSAWQHFEENIKGSIKAGKLADFVILNRNLLKIDPATIKNVKILETIKEGKTIYKNE